MIRTSRQSSFALLTPVVAPPRRESLSILPEVKDPPADLSFIFTTRTHQHSVMALDFETRGDWGAPGSLVVGVGLSDDRGSWYVDLKECHPDTYRWLMERLRDDKVPLIGHNVMFDGGWPYRDFGFHLNWVACTLALYKLTATEGFNGQTWGLKDAQTEMLGWSETNEVLLDKWLIDNGYQSNASKEKKEGYYWYPDAADGEGRWLSPKKAEMWRAPKNILGYYCALDADSTFLLYERILLPVLTKYKALEQYAGPEYIRFMKLLIEQKASGILVDRPRLEKHLVWLDKELLEVEKKLQSHPDIVPYINHRLEQAIREHKAKEPARYTKEKTRPPEPKQFNKDGSPSKSHAAWVKNADKYIPQQSKNWLKWKEREKEIVNEQHFNISSGPQKKELFYQFICKDWKQLTSEKEIAFLINYKGRSVELPATKSGSMPTDKKALKIFGEVGQLFLDYNQIDKEHQYALSCLMVMDQDNILKPGFRVPGTTSGRLAGGGYTVRKPHPTTGKEKEWSINIQQIPKTPGYLSCMIPRPGSVWVDCDHTALEQVVLAELSRDATLWTLYGPAAKPHDVYLFNACSLPGIGEKVKGAGYDPSDPDAIKVAQVKKTCKKERAISKIVTLGSSYGMGAAKLKRTLMLEGIDITIEQARAIHRAYWNLYAGVKDYEAELLDIYKDNGGWILNGIGRPLGIAEDYKRDIVNRVVQSTGHDLHVFYTLIVVDLLKEHGIQWKPIIIDFHDQMIVEVAKKDAERVKQLMGVEAYTRLNKMIGGKLELKGDAQIIKNMAEAKVTKEDIIEYLKELGVLDGEEDEG